MSAACCRTYDGDVTPPPVLSTTPQDPVAMANHLKSALLFESPLSDQSRNHRIYLAPPPAGQRDRLAPVVDEVRLDLQQQFHLILVSDPGAADYSLSLQSVDGYIEASLSSDPIWRYRLPQ